MATSRSPICCASPAPPSDLAKLAAKPLEQLARRAGRRRPDLTERALAALVGADDAVAGAERVGEAHSQPPGRLPERLGLQDLGRQALRVVEAAGRERELRRIQARVGDRRRERLPAPGGPARA